MLVLVLAAQLGIKSGIPTSESSMPPPPECKANLIVQVVDTILHPLPGATVRAKARGTREPEQVARAGGDGRAMLCVAGGVRYELRSRLEGFKSAHTRSDVVAKPDSPSGATRARIQMRPSGPTVTFE
jgi:hypothetical protein